MRLIVGCIGKLKKGPEAELASRYAKRVSQTGRSLGWTGPDIIELPEGKSGSAEQRKADEAERLTAKLPANFKTVVFDERGKAVSSRDFAHIIGRYADEGSSDLALLIGGADGLHASLRERAEHVVSFGRLTIPHQIVRVLVMEQLYRASTILSNHPYHRD